MNAWPLDEGLIDYVDGAYAGPSDANQLAGLNVIANPSFTLSGQQIDAAEITPDLLRTPCTRPTASRPTSPPAITPSSSCSGGRT